MLVSDTVWRRHALHDRRIFLSYGYVQSGASIGTYFQKGKPKAQSRLTFSPLTDSDIFALVKSELRDIASALMKTKEKCGIYTTKCGSGRCRLLEAVMNGS